VEFVIVLVVLGVVVFVVTAPLRRERASRETDAAAGERLAELEAERDAKYREIRDAELDHETGKLSDSDYDALDRTLRAEAVEIMHAIDQETGQSSADPTDVRADPE
jgi:flagellar biosynthesis/type III secretory pathway M-ring protein FliF/YscJ